MNRVTQSHVESITKKYRSYVSLSMYHRLKQSRGMVMSIKTVRQHAHVYRSPSLCVAKLWNQTPCEASQGYCNLVLLICRWCNFILFDWASRLSWWSPGRISKSRGTKTSLTSNSSHGQITRFPLNKPCKHIYQCCPASRLTDDGVIKSVLFAPTGNEQQAIELCLCSF